MRICLEKHDLILTKKNNEYFYSPVDSLSEKDIVYIDDSRYEVNSISPVFNTTTVFINYQTVYRNLVDTASMQPETVRFKKYDVKQTIAPLYVKRFNTRKYMPITYNNYNYDISIKGSLIAKELKLPEWFVIKALTTGVPEYENYNTSLINYIMKAGYTSIESYRRYLISLYSTKVANYINIDKGFVLLAILYLTNYVELSESTFKIIVDPDIFTDKKVLEHLILFFQKNKISVTMAGNKYSSKTEMIVESMLLLNILNNEFSNFNWLLDLRSSSLNSFLFKIMSTTNFYFLTKNKESAYFIRRYLYMNDFITEVEDIGNLYVTSKIVDYEVEDEYYSFNVTNRKIISNNEDVNILNMTHLV